jgi:hypothetical protein
LKEGIEEKELRGLKGRKEGGKKGREEGGKEGTCGGFSCLVALQLLRTSSVKTSASLRASSVTKYKHSKNKCSKK